MIPIPVGLNVKLIATVATVLLFLGMALTIYIMSNKIETLSANLKSSEQINQILNSTIEDQNSKIIEANSKFEKVQKQLYIVKGSNKKLQQEFKTIKDSLFNKPLPKTCDEAIKEMILTGKKIGEMWKKQ